MQTFFFGRGDWHLMARLRPSLQRSVCLFNRRIRGIISRNEGSVRLTVRSLSCFVPFAFSHCLFVPSVKARSRRSLHMPVSSSGEEAV